MLGDGTLFAHRDGVRGNVALMTPILKAWAETPVKDFPNYAAGAWGPPSAADALLESEGRKSRKLNPLVPGVAFERYARPKPAQHQISIESPRKYAAFFDYSYLPCFSSPAELRRPPLNCSPHICNVTAIANARGIARVAISGGTTPKAMFALLASEPFLKRVPWDKLDLYWVDERCVGPKMPTPTTA